jgi:hypothetical protein
MARAYNRSWTHRTCPAHSTYGTGISTGYFNRINYVENQIDYRDILIGDVLEFGNHAAYVVTVPSGTRSDEPDGIYVDHKLDPDAITETTNDELPGVETTYGDCLNIWRKKAAWELKVQNEYTGGQVSVGGSVCSSPYTKTNLHWESWVSISAVDDDKVVGGIKRDFTGWKEGGQIRSTSKTHNVEIIHSHAGYPTWEAQFNDYYHFRFQNSFDSIDEDGDMKVNSTTYTDITLQDTFWVRKTYSISFEAIDMNYNGISYDFDYWSDQSTSRSRTISNVSDHATYTANFEGSPFQVTGFTWDCDYYEPISFYWNKHTNSNVQYRIYRRTRNQYGQITGPTLIDTNSNGDTTYTDDTFMKVSSYIYLIWYDVRAYYTVEQTEAETYWHAIFGNYFLKPGDEALSESDLPTKYDLFNFPNPFNPETHFVYTLPEPAYVSMNIYNTRGQLFTSVFEGHKNAGVHTAKWNGTDASGRQVASGVYFFIMELPNQVFKRKLALIR